jgi:hypothetical protein
MAKHSGKFTTSASPDPTIKQRTKKALADAGTSLRKVVAERVAPETKAAITEIAAQLKADQDDSPALTPAPALPSVEASPSASSETRRPRPFEQARRSQRALRSLYPPNGRTPVKLSAHKGADKINKWLADEKHAAKAPASEAGLGDVSPDTAGRAMDACGRDR